jgi:hypothetical protein
MMNYFHRVGDYDFVLLLLVGVLGNRIHNAYLRGKPACRDGGEE